MKRQLVVFAWLALSGSGLLAPTVHSAQETNWTELNLAVTDTHVIPAYERFSAAAGALVPAAAGLCSQPNAESLASMQAAFHAAMDQWQGIQHVQFGPVTYFNWNFRLEYWPDERNTGSRQLDVVLAAQDRALLESASFERQSVGVQGFPALEQLLFGENALSLLQQQPYRCDVLQAIAANISTIATGIHTRWLDEFRASIANADERKSFENAQDATIEFYKALVETIRKDQQQKLEAVLGASFAEARVRRAESWRSERSLRNIKMNVATLAELFDGSVPALSSALLPADSAKVRAGFATLQATLAAQPDSMTALLQTEAGYTQLVSVRDQMNALFELLEASLKNTDLYLGFNSLDGD